MLSPSLVSKIYYTPNQNFDALKDREVKMIITIKLYHLFDKRKLQLLGNGESEEDESDLEWLSTSTPSSSATTSTSTSTHP